MNTLESVRKPPHAKTMGIEIECCVNDETGLIRRRHHGFFYAGADGSIEPIYHRYYDTTGRLYRTEYHGVEFVSQPLPYEWLCREVMKLGKTFPDWRVNGSCGIHVHVSRKWLSEAQAQRIREGLLFIHRSRMGINTAPVSRGSMTRVHPFVDLFGRGPNSYCMPGAMNRHSSVNMTCPNTIEFRMFSSGNAMWARECLRRVRLMIGYKGKFSYDGLMELFTNPDNK